MINSCSSEEQLDGLFRMTGLFQREREGEREESQYKGKLFLWYLPQTRKEAWKRLGTFYM